MKSNVIGVMEKIKSVLQDKGVSFSLKIILVYVGWKVFWHFADGTVWWEKVTDSVSMLYAKGAEWLLVAFGEQAEADGSKVFLSKTFIDVADHCLAFPAMVVFTGSILLFPGKWQNKLWFIPMGWAIMIIINLIRICFTCYAWVNLSEFYFKVNHSLIYVVVFYSAVFALIIWWRKKFSEPVAVVQ